jgi:multidrug resistance efflux pump
MEQEFIPIEEAMQELQVDRSTWYYYKKRMQFAHHKFPLDKRRYISREDFEQLKNAVEAARTRVHRVLTTETDLLGDLIYALDKFPEWQRAEMVQEALRRLERTAAEQVIEGQKTVAK